ncbi:MAG: NADH-quinone oxidoreductase subunit C [Solirubrobacteraceae bacterium]|nr:NADH-quinone oxidoreductase subunit C [Solirubrobacteraceae bacterium]
MSGHATTSLHHGPPGAARRIDVEPARWRDAAREALDAGLRFSGLFGIEGAGGVVAAALFGRSGEERLLVCDPGPATIVPSLLGIVPAAEWDEREAHDLYGISFSGHEPLRPLVHHSDDLDSWTVEVGGEDTHQVAVGPIHAGIIEPGHFRFHVVGERILHLDLRLFYSHRGLERAAEGREPADALRHAQRACGACAVANSVAFAHAWESAGGLWPDAELARARTTLLELERLYNHLGDISAVCAGVGFAPGTAAFAALKERALRLNRSLAGHRFLFDSVAVGASRLQVDESRARRAREELRELADESARAWRELRFAGSLQERLAGVGVVSREQALRHGAVGPTARACGVARDARSLSPRLAYGDFSPARPPSPTGDVAARVDMRGAELEQTLGLLDGLLGRAIEPARCEPLDSAAPGGDVGVGRIESPRGESVCVVSAHDGRVARMHLRSASYANWPLVAQAARGELLPEFPLINKSFELCYACCDR